MAPRTPFPFPFAPYPIQQQLMGKIYTCIKHKKVGIFESPTGTGKTLSIICSTLQWLREYQEYGSDDEEVGKGGVASAALSAPTPPPAPPSTTSGEPEWCRAFDAQHAASEKSSRLARGREARSELMERLVALRRLEDATTARLASVSLGGVGGGGQRTPPWQGP